MMKRVINATTIECRLGDITQQADMAVIVNAANARLAGGGGVDGAINRAAGPELAKASRKLAPIAPGEAVMTPAFDLPNRAVIHCLGPVYGRDEPSDQLLADCYRNALQLADAAGHDSIAFPAISTGVFGYPMQAAAALAIATVVEATASVAHLRRIRFCLFDAGAEAIHARCLEATR